MKIKCKKTSEVLIIMVCCLNVGFAEVHLHKDNSAVSSKSLDDVRERLETPFMKGLLTNTYQNLIQRIQPDGYLRESITGHYLGMYPRSSGSIGQLLIETGELDKLENALNYILNSMLDNDLERIPHIIGPPKSLSFPIPDKENPGCLNRNIVFPKLTGKFGVAQDFVGRDRPLKALEFQVSSLIPGDTLVAKIYNSQGVRQAVAMRCFKQEVYVDWERLEFASPVKLIAGEKYRVVLHVEKGQTSAADKYRSNEPLVFAAPVPDGMDMLEASKIENGKYISTDYGLSMVFDYGSLKHRKEPFKARLICALDEIDGQAQIITTWALLALHRGETDFENKTYPIMATLMDRSTTQPYLILGEELRWRTQPGLVCNVALEHSRDGQLWHCYDMLTQSFMCSALENMIEVARRRQDTDSVVKWSYRLRTLTDNIVQNMTRDFEGKKIYLEMLLPTGREPEPFPGISWLNLAPVAAGWKGVDKEILKNTIDTWHRVARIKWDGPEMTNSDWLPGQSNKDGGIIGKTLAWDLVYCFRAQEYDRVCGMLDFIEKINSHEIFAECFAYNHKTKKWGVADPGNGEQVAWWCWAMVHIRGEVGLAPLP